MIKSPSVVAKCSLWLFVFALLLASLPTALGESSESDWTMPRGPSQNRSSTAKGLPTKWNPRGGEGSNLVWKREDLGSRSTPVVYDGKLYTLVRDKPGTKNEGEKVVCVDAKTGENVWEYAFNVYLSDVPDTRVAWSSCVVDPETGRVYAMGVCDYFVCLEGDTGKVVWDRSLHEEFGFLSTFGGRTNKPLVFEDTVLISAVVIGWGDTKEFGSLAKPAHRFLCFDKATGDLRWLNGTSISPYDTTYSTPTIAVVDGVQQIIFGSGDGGVWGLQPRTGVRLWNYPLSRRGLDASPLVVGNTVYMSHNQENTSGTAMGAVVALDASQRGTLYQSELWKKYQILAGKNSPVMVDDQLWIVDDGAKLWSLDPKTGQQIGRKSLGRVQRSSPLVADGKVYLCTNGGRWFVLEKDGKRVKILDKQRIPGSNDGSPIVAEGRIYLPSSDGLYCIAGEEAATYVPLPEMPVEKPVADEQPAIVQVIPYDTLLKPGEKQEYRVRIYNAAGQFLQETGAGLPPLVGLDLEYSVSGPGEIHETLGEYVAPTETAHTAALVKCKVGNITGTARVRTVPPLPWKFDFEGEGDLPISWVGGRVRYVKKEIDGQMAAFKRTVLPTPRDPNNKLGTRSRMWMGSPELLDYTIAADVQFTDVNGRKGDFGLINSGYTLTVRSSNKKLRVYSWSPHDHRTYAEVDFEPEAGVWYHLKLRVAAKDVAAIVQGKIWKRGEEEPADWTVHMIDDRPNLSGSPGLYGNAQEAPFYVDNLSVTPNQ